MTTLDRIIIVSLAVAILATLPIIAVLTNLQGGIN